MKRFLPLALIALSATANPMLPYRADYQVWRGDSELGEGYYQLEALGNQQFKLSYQSDVGWLFLSDTRTETSSLRFSGEQVLPSIYRMERTGSGPDFTAEIRFLPKQPIHSRYKDDKVTIEPSAAQFDPLSYQLQLRLDVAQGDTEMLYPIVYKNKAREYRYKVVGEELLSLPFGELDTIKVARDRGENSKRETYLWLARDHNFVLARLIQYKEGDVQAELKLEKLTWLAPPSQTPPAPHP